MKKFKMNNFLQKATDKKWKVGLLISFVGIVSLTLLFTITRGVSGFLSSYTEEIRSIDFESSDWSSNGKGSIHVNKTMEWINSGTAKLKYTIQSNAAIDEEKSPSDYGIDAIFVVDTSTSMQGEKIEKAKEDINSLATEILKDENNKVALVNFSTNASTLSSFTNNKSVFSTSVNNLNANGLTNYEKGLKQVSTLLDGYTVPDNHDVIVFFLTDGAPTSKNHKAEYTYLKQKYPNMIVNAIQYELGKEIISEAKNISDYQFYANKENLYDTLLASYKKASSESQKKIYYNYETFTLTDYLTDEFEVTQDDITTLDGTASYNENTNQIIWNLNDFKTSNSTTMEVTLKVKDGTTINNHKYLGQAEKTEVSYKLPNQVNPMTVNTTKTPVLRLGYDVTYETNIPHDCSNTLIAPTKGTYLAFDTVTKSLENLACDNYLFKGWEVTDDTGEDIKFITNETFTMPEHDVTIRAIWSSLSIAKTQEGTVATPKYYLYDKYIESARDEEGIRFSEAAYSNGTNGHGIYIREGTENDEYPIYYTRGTYGNNVVLFANMCWQIVRTTETGGIKLIYYGNPTPGTDRPTCQNVNLTNNRFTTESNIEDQIGYMYKTNAENDTDSAIKNAVDDWFKKNLTNEEDSNKKDHRKYLEDAVWCNDRSIIRTEGDTVYYGAYDRIKNKFVNQSPLVKDEEVCPQKSDRFTVNESEIGNGALTYPVGLLTADEAALSGLVYDVPGADCTYLGFKYGMWFLTPSYSDGTKSYIFTKWSTYLYAWSNQDEVPFYPSIVLKNDVRFTKGLGTGMDPYEIDTSQ